MLYYIKYGVKALVQDKIIMFWSVAFPLILATLFYFTIFNIAEEIEFQVVPVAVVEGSEEDIAFQEFIKAIDGEIVEVSRLSEEESLQALERGEVQGIFFEEDIPTLTVLQNNIYTSILNSVLQSYVQSKHVIENIAREHPEQLEQAMEKYINYEDVTREVSVDGDTINFTLQFFYALVGMACMYGAFIGMKITMNMQANLTPLAARRCITPKHKLKVILGDTLIAYIIQMMNVTILLFYMGVVLDIGLEKNWGYLLLTTYVGSVIGVSFGAFVGAIGKMAEGTKIAIIIAVSMFFSFFAGLMDSSMKYRVDQILPIFNRINPVALITDSFYSLNTYNDMEQFFTNLTTMMIYSVAFILGTFLLVRRERYDSI